VGEAPAETAVRSGRLQQVVRAAATRVTHRTPKEKEIKRGRKE